MNVRNTVSKCRTHTYGKNKKSISRKIISRARTRDLRGKSVREAPADALVGRSVLFKWPAIGWCIAKITERNVDARVYKKIEDQRVKVNFYLFFEVDQQTLKTCLRLEEHGGDNDFAWVLLDELV